MLAVSLSVINLREGGLHWKNSTERRHWKTRPKPGQLANNLKCAQDGALNVGCDGGVEPVDETTQVQGSTH